MAIIAWRKFLRLLLFTHLLKALWRTIAAVCVTCLNQEIGIILIEFLALCLIIWAEWATDTRTFINIHTEPRHPFKKIVNRPFDSTCGICIFDAQDKLPTSMTGIEP